jgi:hypothetical protein
LTEDEKKELGEVQGLEYSKKDESFLNTCKINDDWP